MLDECIVLHTKGPHNRRPHVEISSGSFCAFLLLHLFLAVCSLGSSSLALSLRLALCLSDFVVFFFLFLVQFFLLAFLSSQVDFLSKRTEQGKTMLLYDVDTFVSFIHVHCSFVEIECSVTSYYLRLISSFVSYFLSTRLMVWFRNGILVVTIADRYCIAIMFHFAIRVNVYNL